MIGRCYKADRPFAGMYIMTVSEKDRLEHHYKYEQDMLSATFAKLSPELDCIIQNALNLTLHEP